MSETIRLTMLLFANLHTDLIHSDVEALDSPDFFLSHWHFTDVTGFALFDAPCDGDDRYYIELGQISQNDRCAPIPDMVPQVDVFAKSFYSAVLTDLGQNKTNLLLHHDSLKYLQDQATMNVTSTTAGVNTTALQDLKAVSATLFMQYQCSVPVLKGVGSVIISVLLADLVFLQALWLLLNFGSVWWLTRKTKSANYCSGCQKPYEAYALMADAGELGGNKSTS